MESSYAELIRAAGLRATAARMSALALLEKSGKPLSVAGLHAAWKHFAPDVTTLYRTLEQMSEAHIIHRLDLNSGTAHYEFTPNKPHHHHIVCTTCRVIEDVDHCEMDAAAKAVTRSSKKFATISSHSLEFFGVCNACAR